MNNIKLLAGVGNVHGFSGTLEGRKFLRFCYGRYIGLQRKPEAGGRVTAHGKVAVVVADSEDEVKSTAQALKRWSENLQADIWTNDSLKSVRVARRIEELIVSEPLVAQMLNDRAAGIRSTDFMESLTSFFFPASQPYLNAVGKQAGQRYAGLFTLWTYSGDSERYRDYYYRSDIHVLIEAHKDLPVMLVHEFSLLDNGGKSLITNRRSGFATYGGGGEAVFYLINYEDPGQRWIELHELDETKTDAPGLTHLDRRYVRKVFSLSSQGKEGAKHKKKLMGFGVGHYDENRVLMSPADDEIRLVCKRSFSNNWDVML